MQNWLNNFKLFFKVEVKELNIELGNEVLDVKAFKKFLESLGATVTLGNTRDTLVDSVRLTSSSTIESMYQTLRNYFLCEYEGV